MTETNRQDEHSGSPDCSLRFGGSMFGDQEQFKRDFVLQFLAAWSYDKWKSGTVNETSHLIPVGAARIAAENACRQVSADKGLMSFQDSMTRYNAANLSQ